MLLAGCAFTVEETPLHYAYSGDPLPSSDSSPRTGVASISVEDDRLIDNPKIITHKRNAYGKTTGGFAAEKPVADIVADGFRDAFEQSGFVFDPKSGEFTIIVSLADFDFDWVAGFSSARIRSEMDVKIRVINRLSNQTVENETFIGRGELETEFNKTESDLVTEAFTKSLDDVIEQVLRSSIVSSLQSRSGTAAKSSGSREGAAAALSLLYEQGLISETEYREKRRALIEAEIEEDLRRIKSADAQGAAVVVSTAAAPAATAERTKLKVAVLPFFNYRNRGCEREVESYLRQVIDRREELDLVYSVYDSRFDSNRAGSPARLWAGPDFRKTPDARVMHTTASDLNADIAFMSFCKKRTAGWYGEEYLVEVYLLDVPRTAIVQESGDELSYKQAVDTAFDELLARRKK